MRNAEMIIEHLKELLEINDEIRKNGEQDEYEDGVVYTGEFGDNLTDYIDCPHYDGNCLNEKKNYEYGTYEWEDTCKACKALWLMEEYE